MGGWRGTWGWGSAFLARESRYPKAAFPSCSPTDVRHGAEKGHREFRAESKPSACSSVLAPQGGRGDL